MLAPARRLLRAASASASASAANGAGSARRRLLSSASDLASRRTALPLWRSHSLHTATAPTTAARFFLQPRHALLHTRTVLRAEEKSKEEESTEETTKNTEGANTTEDDAGKSEIEELKAKLKAAEEKATEFKDKFARSIAEMENVRTRAQRDVNNANKFAIQGFAKALLDVADNLERACNAVPEEKLCKDEHPHLTALHEGVVMTEKTLHNILQQYNITKINALNEPFDPNVHEGMFEFECNERPHGTVGQVIQEGWKLHDRVIRPARVGTTKKPAEN